MILCYALIGIVLINFGYYLFFFRFSIIKQPSKLTEDTYPVSIIVCAKNEADNLKKNIPLYLSQSYPDFELILINDASSDNTLEVMEKFKTQDARVQIVDVESNEAFWGSKKYALTLGIKKARSKRMLFTDADCRPASDQWLSTMAGMLSSEKHLVLGYGAHEKENGLLNTLIRFETAMTAIQYFSYAAAGNPYMGVGRNLAYTSPLYYNNNGFMSHIKIPSGDDDLFVNEVATKENTALCFEAAAFTYSEPKHTFSEWLQQKRRHISTASKYKVKDKLLLGFYYLSNLSFWIVGILAMFLAPWEWVVPIVGIRFLFQYIAVGGGVRKLKEKGLLLSIPILELFLLLTQLSIFISNSRSKPKHWK